MKGSYSVYVIFPKTIKPPLRILKYINYIQESELQDAGAGLSAYKSLGIW